MKFLCQYLWAKIFHILKSNSKLNVASSTLISFDIDFYCLHFFLPVSKYFSVQKYHCPLHFWGQKVVEREQNSESKNALRVKTISFVEVGRERRRISLSGSRFPGAECFFRFPSRNKSIEPASWSPKFPAVTLETSAGTVYHPRHALRHADLGGTRSAIRTLSARAIFCPFI